MIKTMAEESVIKISPSASLREFLCEHFKDRNDAPEGIKVICSPNVPLRKRGGKAALSAENSSSPSYLCVKDFNWLNAQIRNLHENGDQLSGTYLHSLLEGCDIVLPQPPVTERYLYLFSPCASLCHGTGT